MLQTAARPFDIPKSRYSHIPKERAVNIPGIVSVDVNDLFPDIPEPIYRAPKDAGAIRKATEKALIDVNLGMIKTDDTVNILSSEHVFANMGGEHYAEMLKTIKDVLEERTGCKEVRLRIGEGVGAHEAEEFSEQYGFDEYFKGKVSGVGPYDRGIPIETEIGTLYGLAKVYDADWVIHAHHDDPREIHLHRLIYRAIKSFAMSYARVETRSTFHYNFGNRSANFVPRAIFDSPFVQDKYAFCCMLMSSPAGGIGVEAFNDMDEMNRTLTVSILKSYGKLVTLLREIPDCIAVLDGPKAPVYVSTGGIIFGTLAYGHFDFLDLRTGSSEKRLSRTYNPAIKAVVINAILPGGLLDMGSRLPVFIVSREFKDMLILGTEHEYLMTADSLKAAVHFARMATGSDKVIVFDNNYGRINVSNALGDYLLEKAPEVSQRVDNELLPLWLRQRGIDPEKVL